MKRKETLVTKRIGGNKRLIMNWGRGKRDEGSMPGTVECAPVFPMEEFQSDPLL